MKTKPIHVELDARILEILSCLRYCTPFDKSYPSHQIAMWSGSDTRTVSRRLYELAQQGLVEKVGPPRSNPMHYRLAKQKPIPTLWQKIKNFLSSFFS